MVQQISSDIVSSSTGSQRNSNLKLPFPAKLLKILEEAEKDNLTHVVSWLPSGKAFKIHDSAMFVEIVMGKFFKQTKLKSFTRQLYIYGFTKISTGPNLGGFFHPDFVRCNPQACLGLSRRDSNEDRRCKKNRPSILDDLRQSLSSSRKKQNPKPSLERKTAVQLPPLSFNTEPLPLSLDSSHALINAQIFPKANANIRESFDLGPISHDADIFSSSMEPATEMLAKQALPAPPQSLRPGRGAPKFPTLSQVQGSKHCPAPVQSMDVLETLDDVLSTMEPRAIEDMLNIFGTSDGRGIVPSWTVNDDLFMEAQPVHS